MNWIGAIRVRNRCDFLDTARPRKANKNRHRLWVSSVWRYLEWWSWRELNPRPQAFVRQIYMFSGLIWISLPRSRSRTLHGPPAPYFLASTQGTRMEASPCNYPCSREALIAQNPLAQPIGQLLQGSLAIKQRVRNVRRLQLVC